VIGILASTQTAVASVLELSPKFLEVVNGERLWLSAALVFLFARYTAIEFARQIRGMQYPGDLSALREAVCTAYRNRRAAIAMLVAFLGEGLIAVSVWAWRHFDLPIGNQLVTWGALLGIVLFIVGASCAIRSFAPDRWFWWRPWLVIPATGLVFSISLAVR